MRPGPGGAVAGFQNFKTQAGLSQRMTRSKPGLSCTYHNDIQHDQSSFISGNNEL